MNATQLSELRDLNDFVFNKLFYICPFCQKAISTDLQYVTSHVWECSRNRTCLPIVLDNDHS